MPVMCDRCGTTVEGDEPPLTWSMSTEHGQTRRYCEQCTRENVRSIEGKLDSEYW